MSKASIDTDIRDYGLYGGAICDNLYSAPTSGLSEHEAKLFDNLMQYNSAYSGYELSKGEIKTVLQAFERLKHSKCDPSVEDMLCLLQPGHYVAVRGSVTDACITIQNDLLSCKDVMALGKKYTTYQNILKSFFLKGLEEICNQDKENSNENNTV